MPCTANQAIALWLQSTLLVGRVSELGPLERNVRNKTAKRPTLRSSVTVKDEEEVCLVALSPTQPNYALIQPPRYLFTALKKSMIALFFPGHSGCVPLPSQ